MNKELLVIKFGTASITKENGEPDENIIAKIAQEVSELHKIYHIVLVSSGAVGAGKHFIVNYEGNLSQRKAAAAIGNPLLLKMYSSHFEKFGIQVAQSLCERQHFANRQQFLQLKETYQELWKNNVIPIANENDVVSNRELKFSDNDELATLIAGGFGASVLMLCTSAGGFLNNQNEIISLIPQIDENVLSLVHKSKSDLGLGGMTSKLTFAHLATKMGIKVIIFGMNEGISSALSQTSGSTFLPQKVNISAKNKWMASGGLSVGKITIDMGAVQALLNRKSLLAIGVLTLEGEFEETDLVDIYDQEEQIIAVGQIKVSSRYLEENLNKPNLILVHADDLVLL